MKYYKQETIWTCGTASMRMILNELGIKKSERELVNILHTNMKRGTWFRDLSRVAEKYKLNYIVERNSNIKRLKEVLNKKYLVIIPYDPFKCDCGHYAIIRKIEKDKICFYDPWFGENHCLKISYFNRIWKMDIEKEKRAFIGIKKVD